jgi:hypothetical protein
MEHIKTLTDRGLAPTKEMVRGFASQIAQKSVGEGVFGYWTQDLTRWSVFVFCRCQTCCVLKRFATVSQLSEVVYNIHTTFSFIPQRLHRDVDISRSRECMRR